VLTDVERGCTEAIEPATREIERTAEAGARGRRPRCASGGGALGVCITRRAGDTRRRTSGDGDETRKDEQQARGVATLHGMALTAEIADKKLWAQAALGSLMYATGVVLWVS